MSRYIIVFATMTALLLSSWGCRQESKQVAVPPPPMPPETQESTETQETTKPVQQETPAETVKSEQPNKKEEPNVPETAPAEPNVQPVTQAPETITPPESNLIKPESKQNNLTPAQLCQMCTDFLIKYVNKEGLVDYRILLRKKIELLDVLDAFKNVSRSDYNSWPKNDKTAFWINEYNLQLTRIILENYPIKTNRILLLFWPPNSIRHIKGIWDQYKFIVMDEEFTLMEIENRFFRGEFNDPRVFFAISYASVSGPPLRNEAYCGPDLSRQLDEQVKKFVSEPKALRIDRQNQKVYLSPLLTPGWQGKYFVAKYGTDLKFKSQQPEVRAVLNFLTKYLSANDIDYLETGNYTIEFMTYDWSVNEQHGGQ